MILNSPWLVDVVKQLTVTNIDETLAEQRRIISEAQQRIVVLTIFRAAVVRAEEVNRISKRAADAEIDEALAKVNQTPAPRFTSEGGMN